jgi:hypothetical protein
MKRSGIQSLVTVSLCRFSLVSAVPCVALSCTSVMAFAIFSLFLDLACATPLVDRSHRFAVCRTYYLRRRLDVCLVGCQPDPGHQCLGLFLEVRFFALIGDDGIFCQVPRSAPPPQA